MENLKRRFKIEIIYNIYRKKNIVFIFFKIGGGNFDGTIQEFLKFLLIFNWLIWDVFPSQ